MAKLGIFFVATAAATLLISTVQSGRTEPEKMRRDGPCLKAGMYFSQFYCGEWLHCLWNEEKKGLYYVEHWCDWDRRNDFMVVRDKKNPYCKFMPKDGKCPYKGHFSYKWPYESNFL